MECEKRFDGAWHCVNIGDREVIMADAGTYDLGVTESDLWIEGGIGRLSVSAPSINLSMGHPGFGAEIPKGSALKVRVSQFAVFFLKWSK